MRVEEASHHFAVEFNAFGFGVFKVFSGLGSIGDLIDFLVIVFSHYADEVFVREIVTKMRKVSWNLGSD